MEVCCLCGKSLPNRYAIAGTCQDAGGCRAPFCALCWRNSDKLCPAHGGRRKDKIAPLPPAPVAAQTPLVEPQATPTDDEAKTKTGKIKQALNKENALRAMKWTVSAVTRIGKNAVALAGRLRKDNSPEAMIATLDASLQALTPKREKIAKELEDLYNRIAAGKQSLATAAPARKRVIEAELAALLAQYRASERQFRILLDNERHVNAVRNRLEEMTLYGMAAVDEDLVDAVSDDIEDAVGDAEDREDAIRDLERAGRTRDSGDHDALMQELDDFVSSTEALPDRPAINDAEAPVAMPTAPAARAIPATLKDAPAPADSATPLADDDLQLPVPPLPASQPAEKDAADGIPQ